MTNNVCYEVQSVECQPRDAESMIGRNFRDAKTAFIGCRQENPEETKLYLVNRRCVFDAEKPFNYYVNTQLFMVEKWVDIDMYIKEIT